MFELNVARIVRRVGEVVGGTVTCDLAAADGFARVSTPLDFVLRRGSDSFVVSVTGEGKPLAVGTPQSTGRFAAAEKEIRRRIVEVLGDVKFVPGSQAVPATLGGNESLPPSARPGSQARPSPARRPPGHSGPHGSHWPPENAELDARVMVAVADFRNACEDAGVANFEALIRANVLQQRPAAYWERVWACVDLVDVDQRRAGGDAQPLG